jgi:hypothetical protein
MSGFDIIGWFYGRELSLLESKPGEGRGDVHMG